MKNITHDRKIRRARRIRGGIQGSSEKPRISVFRSNVHFYVQAIDDKGRKTLSQVSSVEKEIQELVKGKTKTETARILGKTLAERMIKIHIQKGIFDRGRFAYNGRVKSCAEGLREGGISI